MKNRYNGRLHCYSYCRYGCTPHWAGGNKMQFVAPPLWTIIHTLAAG